MVLKSIFESPFVLKFSFEKLLLDIKKQSENNPEYAIAHKNILEKAVQFPELMNGIDDLDFFENQKDLLDEILQDFFPKMVTKNEIKAIGFPLYNFFFHPTERFQNILEGAGKNFDIWIKDLEPKRFYVICCCIILRNYYHIELNFSTPFIFDIPKQNGIMNHYRLTTNADFIDINPISASANLSQEDIYQLLNNFDDFDLWEEKFPPKSWEMKGFAIITLFDTTTEVAISNLKTRLINIDAPRNLKPELDGIFRSIFQVPDLEVGFTGLDMAGNKFVTSPLNQIIDSHLLTDISGNYLQEENCSQGFNELLKDRRYFSFSDVDRLINEFPDGVLLPRLYEKGFKSMIFAPILKNGKLLGVIELVSKTKSLNSVIANKMEIVMPYLEDTIDRIFIAFDTQVEAIIQKEYTSIHPSVSWKFREEAQKHISFKSGSKKFPYQDIAFQNLVPLFGQTDIKNSSVSRNSAIQNDLKINLDLISKLINKLPEFDFSNIKAEIKNIYKTLEIGLLADTDHLVQNLILKEIHPLFTQIKTENPQHFQVISDYENVLDNTFSMFYENRKKFDDSIAEINRNIASLIDKRQEEQQKIFPFYFERFKTDGVEHNMYIGSSINPELNYSKDYLKNLRMWQLRVLCETELQFHQSKSLLSYPLEVTSLILVYSTPINIRFRMDEKRFDVDGSYNARYEMIKKRIDKSTVKNSDERITEVGKISIIYSREKDKLEYLEYLKILQNEGVLLSEIEDLEVEDLQGISGLRALRVGVNYD